MENAWYWIKGVEYGVVISDFDSHLWGQWSPAPPQESKKLG